MLPEEFESRLREIIPEDRFDSVLASFSDPRDVGLRVNTLVSSVAEIESWAADQGIGLSPLDWQPTGFLVSRDARERLTHSPLAGNGSFYIQSLSSQYASMVLDPQPGQTVLDLAAAPGGKSTHLAALMQNQGMLSAVEPIRGRFFRLQATLKRMNVMICRTYMSDGRTVGRKTGERFERVLLDAPCSSESRMHLSRSKSLSIWSQRKIRECSRKQAGLIRSAFKALLPGGRLLYCTCSFAPEENERIVSKLLDEYPDRANLVPLGEVPFAVQPGMESFRGENFGPAMSLCRRILPTQQMEGFFLALIAKS